MNVPDLTRPAGLVLTRREGDAICIGDDVRVVVVAIARRQVRLRIQAPRTTAIRREEITARNATVPEDGRP